MKVTPLQLDCAAAATAGFAELAELTVVPRPVVLILVVLSVLPAAVRRLWPRIVLALSKGDPAPQLAVGFVIYLIPSRFSRRQALWLLGGTLASLAENALLVGGGLLAAIRVVADGDALVSMSTTKTHIGRLLIAHRGYPPGAGG